MSSSLKTLKDIEIPDYRLDEWRIDLRQAAMEWIEKECIPGMDNADERNDRESYNFFAGKMYAFKQFFNLEED